VRRVLKQQQPGPDSHLENASLLRWHQLDDCAVGGAENAAMDLIVKGSPKAVGGASLSFGCSKTARRRSNKHYLVSSQGICRHSHYRR
jgi:hypothetical protein